jgi:hypothetical protein
MKRLITAVLTLVASVQISYAEMLPASDDRLLVESDLVGMTSAELRVARNEIFARHGYAFNSTDLQAHFSQYPWYNPFTKNVSLSSVEQANVGFIKRYEDSPSLQANIIAAPKAAKRIISQQTTVVVASDSEQLAAAQAEINELSAQIASLQAVVEQQRAKAQEFTDTSIHDLAEAELTKLMEALKRSMKDKETFAVRKYQTPVKPQTDHSKSSPRELARHFPKIPWYDPKYVDQIGEFWLESRVSDDGVLMYDVKFLEPEHTTQNVASEFTLLPDDADKVMAALVKTYAWAETAKENNVRDFFRKTVDCTPVSDCEEKIAGNTSTQVDFLVLEQGAIGVRLVRNKGAFTEEYGLSLESAALLASYFDFVLELGKNNFEAGTRTAEDLDSLFE